MGLRSCLDWQATPHDMAVQVRRQLRICFRLARDDRRGARDGRVGAVRVDEGEVEGAVHCCQEALTGAHPDQQLHDLNLPPLRWRCGVPVQTGSHV